MATYRQIHTHIWDDPKFEELSPHAKLLFIYGFSNKHRNEAGIYTITVRKIAFETGLTIEQAEAAIKEIEAAGMWRYDWENHVLWIKNALKYQSVSEKCLVAIRRDIDSISSQLVEEFKEYYKALLYPTDRVSIGYPKPTDNLAGKGKGKGKGKVNVKDKGKDPISDDLSNNAAVAVLTGEGCGEGENSDGCGGENNQPEKNGDANTSVTGNIAAVLQKCGILMPSPLEVEKIAFWLEKGMEFGVFELAAEKAALANVRRVSYIESILRQWFNAGIRTREQAEGESSKKFGQTAIRAAPAARDTPEEEKPWYLRESTGQPKIDFRLVETLKEALGDGSAD
ncbi:MAG: DnaD domain protein [Thermoanaerobacter sp.]|nr:DnaD domain protein [Thermoanaerobacter sp.]